MSRGACLGGAVLAAALFMLALQPTDHWWWLVRAPGLLGLLLSGMALLLPPAPDATSWHRLLGTFAIIAVSLHVLSVAAIEPFIWQWLSPATPIEIICGLVAALALLATLALRRSRHLRSGLGSKTALLFHRIAGFTAVIAASAHVALVAGTGPVIIACALGGSLLIAAAPLVPEPRKLILLVLPAILAGMIAALAVGPLAQARLSYLRLSPIDHARFLHDDHTDFVCTTCHHNFIDRTGKENCLSCHKRLSMSEAMRVDRLFHAFCSDCHRRESLAGRKSGPVDHCTACHGG
jgi:hypothetical protein